MIVHSIVVHKPIIALPQNYGPAPVNTLTQEQLNKLHESHGFSKGMFIKYKEITSVHSLFQIFYVCELITNADELTYNYKGEPLTLRVANLGQGTGMIKRLEVSYQFLPLTEEEIQAYITNNDILLHRIKTL